MIVGTEKRKAQCEECTYYTPDGAVWFGSTTEFGPCCYQSFEATGLRTCQHVIILMGFARAWSWFESSRYYLHGEE